MKTVELKGLRSLRALNAFHTLMLGLKMLPMYQMESYPEFFARIEAMPESDQVKVIKEAALFVELQREELEALAHFCRDSNGVPFSAENLNNLTPDQIIEMIVAIGIAVLKIKIDFVSDDEKKK